MKALNIRCHVGAQIGAQVYTSLDAKIHGCTLEMTDTGVIVTGTIGGRPIDPHFIPMSTIASIRLGAEDFTGAEVTHLEPKRKAGRPPKASEAN